MAVNQQFYLAWTADELVKYHSEVLFYCKHMMEKKLVMLFAVSLLSGGKSVEFLPDDGGPLGEFGKAGKVRLTGIVATPQELPRVDLCDVV